jgi:hypothetical protein
MSFRLSLVVLIVFSVLPVFGADQSAIQLTNSDLFRACAAGSSRPRTHRAVPAKGGLKTYNVSNANITDFHFSNGVVNTAPAGAPQGYYGTAWNGSTSVGYQTTQTDPYFYQYGAFIPSGGSEVAEPLPFGSDYCFYCVGSQCY